MSFWARNLIILFWKTLSLQYTATMWSLKILVDLGGILAYEYLEKHMYGWLGRAIIRFGCCCASGCFCWQKEEDEHLPPIRSFDDDDDLWRSMEDLMMMHEKMLKT